LFDVPVEGRVEVYVKVEVEKSSVDSTMGFQRFQLFEFQFVDFCVLVWWLKG
jgi:hypothetical protein